MVESSFSILTGWLPLLPWLEHAIHTSAKIYSDSCYASNAGYALGIVHDLKTVAEITEVSYLSWVNISNSPGIKHFAQLSLIMMLCLESCRRRCSSPILPPGHAAIFVLTTKQSPLTKMLSYFEDRIQIQSSSVKYSRIILTPRSCLDITILAHFCCHSSSFSFVTYIRPWRGTRVQRGIMRTVRNDLYTQNCCQLFHWPCMSNPLCEQIKTKRTSYRHPQGPFGNIQILSKWRNVLHEG